MEWVWIFREKTFFLECEKSLKSFHRNQATLSRSPWIRGSRPRTRKQSLPETSKTKQQEEHLRTEGRFSAQRWLFPLNSRRCVTVTNIYYSSAFSNCQDGSTAAAEETNEQDVVLIKEETPKEEAESDLATTDELLISEDGEQASKMYLIPGGGTETLCGC